MSFYTQIIEINVNYSTININWKKILDEFTLREAQKW